MWSILFFIALAEMALGNMEGWRILALISLVMVYQRRPFARNIPFSKVDQFQFGAVSGIFARGDILMARTGDRTIHLVPSKPISNELRRILESRLKGKLQEES
ncbi:MAG: hypothetical protein DWQ01_01155 [Planctomycetota bacterium]|nr:MAG: hypothetical protein DWQ01_01155 [Planctomycetota bacterium]